MNVTAKLTGLLLILFLGIALGLQAAEKGIYKVEGLPEQKPQTFYIKKIDNGEMEIAVMGKHVEARPKEMVNYVSSLGNSLGQAIKTGIQQAVDWLSSYFEPS
ncbi:hypothetical protein GCM10023228_07820 [Brevibacillus fulvus]|uniref:PurR-regulated permease PerM n=1 Tax=Brevibacillus fulvus TaxID=1125967 RepID=A0A939BRQ7_9BACL|nr:putative PurR-regulated permease PerM [Brevibacillus fulvus]